ncbi:hypothetical protein S245_037115, partial [Arachis hypogaea]
LLVSCFACSAVFDLLLTSCFSLLCRVQSFARALFYSALPRSIFCSCHSETSRFAPPYACLSLGPHASLPPPSSWKACIYLSKLQDILPNIIHQFGRDNMKNLKKLEEQFQKQAPDMASGLLLIGKERWGCSKPSSKWNKEAVQMVIFSCPHLTALRRDSI